MRKLRRIVDTGLPIAGTLVVFGGVLFGPGLYAQLLLVMVGMLMVDAGIWKLAHPLLPSERRFYALREEVDRFVPSVRRLNQAALARDGGDPAGAGAFESARAELHAAVERMAEVAGIAGDGPRTSRAPATPSARN